MGNGCFNLQEYQQSVTYLISRRDESELSILCEVGKKQSQISYPIKLDTLDNFEDCFFQKEFAFIEPVVSSLVEAQTQTPKYIDGQGLKFNNAATQTKNVVQKEYRIIKSALSQSPSKLSQQYQSTQNRALQQITYKTAMKRSGNLVGMKMDPNSQNSLEKQFELTPGRNKRYQLASSKNVRFADSKKFSLPMLLD